MNFLDPQTIITSGGLALIAFIVFAESGLLFGFFFPGDTLLFLAGTLAAQGQFPIASVTGVIAVSAIAGGQVGYLIGKRTGPKLFTKEDGIVFKKEYVSRSEHFYENHGGKTVILARFIPIIRTFAPVVAGIGNMNYRRFTIYNVIGSTLWSVSVTLAGFFFGKHIPNIDKVVLPVIAVVMVLSFAPTMYHVLKDQRSRALLVQKIRVLFTRSRS